MLEDMKKVQDLVKQILDNKKSIDELDSHEDLDVLKANGHTVDDAKTVEKEAEEMGIETKPKKKKQRSQMKTPSQSKLVNDVKFHVQRNLAYSIFNEEQLVSNTAVDLEAEMMTEEVGVLDNKEADVL